MELSTNNVTEKQAQAWLGMAKTKNSVVSELEAMELSAQKFLLADLKEFASIDLALLNYRKEVAAITEFRKSFTNKITVGIIEPLMAFEKRLDPKVNEAYKELELKSLNLRKEATTQAQAANLKNAEKASFQSFLCNELNRIESAYKSEVRKQMNSFYNTALKAKTKDGLNEAKEMLKSVEFLSFSKFTPQFLSNEEMKDIYSQVPTINKLELLSDLVCEFDELFEFFDVKIQNSEAAIKASEKAAQDQEEKAQARLEEEVAISTLLSKVDVAQVTGPKLKKTVSIIVEETDNWASLVMTNYILNMQSVAKYRRGALSKLTILQMSEQLSKYITETGDVLKGLQLEETWK